MKRRKLAAATAFALAATMMLSSAMGVLAADTDVSVSDNKITFDTGGGTVTPPVDPEDPDKEIDPDDKEVVTDNKGSLRLDVVPAFDFGTQQIKTGIKNYYAELPKDKTLNEAIPYYAQVTDVRGTGAGWRLSAKMTSQFSDGTNTLTGAKIKLKNVATKAQSGTTAPGTTWSGDLTYDAQNGGTVLDLASAAVNEGMGVSAVRFGNTDRDGGTLTADESVELEIPADTQVYKATYKATIQWTLGATP